MSAQRLARISLVVFVVIAAQVAFTAQVPVAGVIIPIALIATISAGLVGGAQAGAGVGFACGILLDLLGAGPVGITSLVYTIVGYAVGVSQADALHNSRLIPVVTSAIATPIAIYAQAFVGEVLGQHVFATVDVSRVALVATIAAIVLCLPIGRIVAWGFAPERSVAIRGSSRW